MDGLPKRVALGTPASVGSRDRCARSGLDGAARSTLAAERDPIRDIATGDSRPPLRVLEILLLLALWLALHPYMGIIHDARLYLAQAINRLDNSLEADLFFAYGSQESFTIFPTIYQYIVGKAGYPLAHIAVTAVGQTAWFAAMLYFTRSLFGPKWHSVAACGGIILLYPFYDGVHALRYAEAFATPRLYAEALVLIALGAIQRGRGLAASISLLAATALHPLVGLPAIAVAGILLAVRDKRLWLLYAAGLATAIALATLGVEPLARILVRFDGQWFATVYQRASVAFLTRWEWYLALGPVSQAAVLAMAWTRAAPAERRLIAAVCAVAAAGVGLTLLGADMARNVLVADIQPWRSLWLLAVLGNAWAPIVAYRLPAGWLSREMAVCALVGQAALTAFGTSLPFPATLFIGAALCFTWEWRTQRRLAAPFRVAARLATATVIAASGFAVYMIGPVTPEPILPADIWKHAAGLAVAAAAVGMLAMSIRGSTPSAILRMPIAAVLIGAALLVLDRRGPWQKFLDDPGIPPSLARLVGDTPSLYWEAELGLLWLKLGRPNYFSCEQGAGVMFFRGTALEYQRRADALSVLDTRDFAGGMASRCPPKHDPDRDGPRSAAQLAAACRALPELDAMVLTTLVPDAPHMEWQAPADRVVERRTGAGGGPRQTNTFYLYGCATWR